MQYIMKGISTECVKVKTLLIPFSNVTFNFFLHFSLIEEEDSSVLLDLLLLLLLNMYI